MLCNLERVVDLNAEKADCALQLGVTEQERRGSEYPSANSILGSLDMQTILRLVAALAVATLAACGTTRADISYVPTTSMTKATSSPVSVGSFVDARGEQQKNWAGAIRGGFGNPLKVLELDRPVAEVVRTAFADALLARGVGPIASGSGTQLSGVVRKFECDQYVRREATIEVELTVLGADGQSKFTRVYRGNNVEGSLVTLNAGVFGSVEELRAVLEKTLRETVDKALEDTALRSALQI